MPRIMAVQFELPHPHRYAASLNLLMFLKIVSPCTFNSNSLTDWESLGISDWGWASFHFLVWILALLTRGWVIWEKLKSSRFIKLEQFLPQRAVTKINCNDVRNALSSCQFPEAQANSTLKVTESVIKGRVTGPEGFKWNKELLLKVCFLPFQNNGLLNTTSLKFSTNEDFSGDTK